MNELKVSAIQTDIVWEDREANLKQLEGQLNKIEKQDIILLPEMFTTGFTMNAPKYADSMMGTTVHWMKNMAKKTGAAVGGSVIIRDSGNYYNRFLWAEPKGDVHYYDKRHLFSYGKEDKSFTAGEERVIIEYKGWKINLNICYDLRFPVWSRNQSDYDILIYVANWPEQRSLAWKTLLQARAIENQAYVIGVNRIGEDGAGNNYVGDTTIIEYDGKVIDSMHIESGIVRSMFNKKRLKNFREDYRFLEDADRFKLL